MQSFGGQCIDNIKKIQTSFDCKIYFDNVSLTQKQINIKEHTKNNFILLCCYQSSFWKLLMVNIHPTALYGPLWQHKIRSNHQMTAKVHFRGFLDSSIRYLSTVTIVSQNLGNFLSAIIIELR